MRPPVAPGYPPAAAGVPPRARYAALLLARGTPALHVNKMDPRSPHASDTATATTVDGAGSFDAPQYWERRLTAFDDLRGVGFTRLGRRYNESLYRLRSEVFRARIAEWHLAGRPLEVLDVGSGTGHYVREWLRAGAASVTATDLTGIAVERLRRDFPGVETHRFDAGATERPPQLGQYDVVSAFDVLFHIVDDAAYARALHNCHALCRPGGYFVFSDLFVRAGRARPSGRGGRAPHVASRTLDEITDAVRAAGFVILDRRPMFVLMNYPIDAGPLARLAWSAVAAPSMVSETYGGLLGRLLMPYERRLVQWRHESPTTEIMLCRRLTDVAPGVNGDSRAAA